MRSNFFTSTALVALLFFTFFSCRRDNESCGGTPKSIRANERLAFQFYGSGNESIFKDDFKMDSLKIFENENELEFTIDSTYYFEVPMVYFVSNITKWDSIESHFGDTLKTQILIEFGVNKMDTLKISSVPSTIDNPCRGTAYGFIEMSYNSVSILHYEENETTERAAIGTIRPFIVYVYE